MLARRTESDAKLRKEFDMMQRAQFIQWLMERDPHLQSEIEEAERAIANGEGTDWEEIRREMNARFNV